MSEFDKLLETWLDVSEKMPLRTHYSHGRLKIVGPWQFLSGWKWQAIAEPYNGQGRKGIDDDIEAIGDTMEEAAANLRQLLLEASNGM